MCEHNACFPMAKFALLIAFREKKADQSLKRDRQPALPPKLASADCGNSPRFPLTQEYVVFPVLILLLLHCNLQLLPQHYKTIHTKLRGRFSCRAHGRIAPISSSLGCRTLRLLFLFIACFLYGSYTEDFKTFLLICQD